jgi:hypothetical protein
MLRHGRERQTGRVWRPGTGVEKNDSYPGVHTRLIGDDLLHGSGRNNGK